MHFITDASAAADLTRVKTPWLIGICNWDDRLIRKSVVWLCEKLQKPILKLTDKDYNDNGMNDLITQVGSAYDINIRVFNDLQHTITGWPGGKPSADDSQRPERALPYPKRVLIFSPHPDDDVISMGGTFLRLLDNGHEVHVAYQTSGNIAVSDTNALQYIEFAKNLHAKNAHKADELEAYYQKVHEFLQAKTESEADILEVRQVKSLIRQGEAIAAAEYLGAKRQNLHFLELPFYETGKAKKLPVSHTDIERITTLMQELKPQQIYAAGDLSDPHGTHRVCLDAVLHALDRLKNEAWMRDCWVWLYRGAWQEWELDQVDMAVPISPGELMKKRISIFKHQSQNNGAMFPGNDSREFWQRAEDRNRGTAQRYDQIGMAEYEAIEAFVRYLPQ
jgi:glucosamine-6-phosphate deaminase